MARGFAGQRRSEHVTIAERAGLPDRGAPRPFAGLAWHRPADLAVEPFAGQMRQGEHVIRPGGRPACLAARWPALAAVVDGPHAHPRAPRVAVAVRGERRGPLPEHRERGCVRPAERRDQQARHVAQPHFGEPCHVRQAPRRVSTQPNRCKRPAQHVGTTVAPAAATLSGMALTLEQRLAALEASSDLGAKLDKIAAILTGRPAGPPGAAPGGLGHWLLRLSAHSPFTGNDAGHRARSVLSGIDAPSAALIDTWEPGDANATRATLAADAAKLDTAATATANAERQRAILAERSQSTGRAAASYAEIERHRAAVAKANETAATAKTAAAGLTREKLTERAAALDGKIDTAREARAADAIASIAAAMPGAIAAQVVHDAGERARETGRDPGAALATAIRTGAASEPTS